MKTFISALGAIVLGLFPLNAQFLINPYKVQTSGTSYTATADVIGGTTNGSTQVGNSGLNVIAAGVEFTAAGVGTYTITKIDLSLAKVGSPTQDFYAEIWTQSGSLPGTIVGTQSAAVNGASLPASEGTVSFILAGSAITAGTNYYVVFRAASMSATDYALFYRISATGRIDVYNPSGGTWSNSSTTRRSKFQLYTSP